MGDRQNFIRIAEADNGYAAGVGRLAESFSRAAVVPILGAGISSAPPSCLPAAWPLMNVLRQTLWAATMPLTKNGIYGDADYKAAEAVVKKASLERLLSVMEEMHGRERTIHEYLAPLQGTLWNWNHAALASLACEGFLPYCITLNFDLLIEEAIRAAGGGTNTECPLGSQKRQLPATASFAMGRNSVWTRIIKPHGSFAPPESGFGSSDLVATTLPELGDRPDPRNDKTIANLLTTGKELFVAGYSDDDWDVFPIIKQYSSRLSHISWVHYVPPDKLATESCPWDPSDQDEGWQRHAHIRAWLREQSIPFTSFIGDPALLLRRVNEICRLKPMEPAQRFAPAPVPDAWPFLNYQNSVEAQIRTAASMAVLLQDRGRFNDVLLQKLLRHPFVRSEPLLEARLHRVLAHTNHTRRKLPRAIRHMKQVIALKTNHGQSSGAAIADDLVWLGYEYLCLIKRPGLRWLATRKYHRMGMRRMIEGVRLAKRVDPALYARLRPFVRYYAIDLRHTWASLRMFWGMHAHGEISKKFQPLARKYEQLERDFRDFMAWDYYWLRGLEASLLAKRADLSHPRFQDVESRLEVIEHRYDILQNQVQSGNPQIFKALLLFVRDGEIGSQRQKELLDLAETKWSARGGEARSGLYRVIQFRRFLGLDNPLQSGWRILKCLLKR